MRRLNGLIQDMMVEIMNKRPFNPYEHSGNDDQTIMFLLFDLQDRFR